MSKLRFRWCSSLVAAGALLVAGGLASAGEAGGKISHQKAGSVQKGGHGCSICGGGLFGGNGLFGGRGGAGGMAGRFAGNYNCSCNGTYKWPVPPLYTYFWPGMHSHQLMTDYHTPWRFPPIKPYTPEPNAPAPYVHPDGRNDVAPPVTPAAPARSPIREAQYVTPALLPHFAPAGGRRFGKLESQSEKMERMNR